MSKTRSALKRKMEEQKFHLAQCNIAYMRAPLSDPLMKDFSDLLAPINKMADESPGFIWRLQSYEGNATSIRAWDDELILFNMSVWNSVDALRAYTYGSGHADVMRNRARWFHKHNGRSLVLWWIPAGHLPSIVEAKERLEYLQEHGPTPRAFDFRNIFAPVGDGDPAGRPYF